MNKGFITVGTERENVCIDTNCEMPEKRKKKTKGISYTRNAQELKRLLLDTGVLGGISFAG